MKTIIQEAISLLQSGSPFVLATVIRTWGSAPRKAGSHMLITREKMFGSVSGGCVENDVFRNAKEIIGTDENKLIHYGVSDEDAWQVGLSCGGQIDVLLETFSPTSAADIDYWNTIHSAIGNNFGAVTFHKLGADKSIRHVFLSGTWPDDATGVVARESFSKRAHQIMDIDGVLNFIEVIPPKHQLLIFGAAHMTTELVKLAKQFDFETFVIDPRGLFVDNTSFAEQPDHIFHAWPAEVLADLPLTPYTYSVTLSHDPKIDDQALELLLKSEVAYIGALGSKKTHAKRVQRLLAKGFSEALLQRIHAPVGIDIHAQSAQEIALSILADLILEKNKYIA